MNPTITPAWEQATEADAEAVTDLIARTYTATGVPVPPIAYYVCDWIELGVMFVCRDRGRVWAAVGVHQQPGRPETANVRRRGAEDNLAQPVQLSMSGAGESICAVYFAHANLYLRNAGVREGRPRGQREYPNLRPPSPDRRDENRNLPIQRLPARGVPLTSKRPLRG